MSKARAKIVVDALQRLYPKELADSKWDNTGLLVDALDVPSQDTSEKQEAQEPKVLLTIDLTTSVCEEALQQKSDLVVAYHPFIFGGIKSISSSNSQHRSLIRLLQAGISVYSPHTAIDASTHGVNDWLVHCVTAHGTNEASKVTAQPISPAVAGQPHAGYGRIVTLKKPVPLEQLVTIIKGHLWLSTVQLVQSPRHATEPISTIAICAGSGGSVLRGTKADLWFTGELGHHEMLHLKENGTSAIVCGHSNTERGFLPILRGQLSNELKAHGQSAIMNLAETDVDPIRYA